MYASRTIWDDMEEWRRSHGYFEGTIHCFFLLSAVAICMLCPDYMHIVDLGVEHYALGGAIFELIYLHDYFPAFATVEARRAELWRRISGQYAAKRSPVQLSNLELTFFCDPRTPHQSQPVLTTRVKAAETRRQHFLYRK